MKHLFACLVLTTSFLSALPQDGSIVARWSFEETLDNTTTGSTTTLDDGQFEGGSPTYSAENAIRGSYLTFDGVDDYVTVGDGNFFNELDTTWSASAWFRADSAPAGNDRFFVFETASSFPISLGLREGDDPGNTKIQIFSDTVGSNASIDFEVPDSEITDWNHVVITFFSTGAATVGSLSAHLNGGSNQGGLSTNMTISLPETSATGFRIGTYRNADGRYFSGDIDEVVLWDTTLSPTEAQAVFSPVVVNTLVDEDDGDLSGDISLREAIRYAPNDLIEFDPSLNGGSIFLERGQLTVTRSLRIDASSLLDGITIDGLNDGDFFNSSNETRCFVVDGGGFFSTGLQVAFKNLIIRDGFLFITTSLDGGANILNRESLTLIDCQILNGRTRAGSPREARGSGIHNDSFATLTMVGCTVSGNETNRDGSPSSEFGAGIYNAGRLRMDTCIVSNNRTTRENGHGGGIYNSGSLAINDCTIADNQTQGASAHGGGIYNGNFGGLTMTRSTVSENQAIGTGANGGGIYNTGSLAINDCTIADNRTHGASAHGGGIHNDNFGELTMRRSTVSGNQTIGTGANGGGIYNSNAFSSETFENLISDCTITKNIALQTGGGIFNQNGSVKITHCTIVENRSAGVVSVGGGLATTEVSFSIISENAGDHDIELFDGTSNTFNFEGENLIGSAQTEITNISPNSASIHLAPLGDYGGPTQTKPPLPNSPAIQAAGSSILSLDQRGHLRGVGSSNIGAVEADDDLIVDENNNLGLVVTTRLDEPSPLPSDFNFSNFLDYQNTTRSLRDAIILASSYSSSFEETTITFDEAVFNGDNTIALNLGELAVTGAITIDGSGIPEGIVVDGNGDGDFVQEGNETRCFLISDDDSISSLEVIFKNLTIQDGSYNGLDAGANIHNQETLTLEECRVLNGRAFGNDARGGGIFSDGDLILSNCAILDNETDGDKADGGGICSLGSSITMTNCTVSGNGTNDNDSRGGGIYTRFRNLFGFSDSERALTMINCTVADNQTAGESSDGGGIYSSNVSLTMTDCTVSDNQTTDFFSDGGGIYSVDTSLTMTGCTVSGNQTIGFFSDGGGISTSGTSIDSTDSDPDVSRFTNCTFSGNMTRGVGGEILNLKGLTEIEHCTIITPSSAAGVVSGGDVKTRTRISHSIVTGSRADVSLHEGSIDSFEFVGQNLISTAGFGVAAVLNTEALLLAPLGDYAGPTAIRPPLPGSPAINAAIGSMSSEDQRGLARDASPDIGAVESDFTTNENNQSSIVVTTALDELDFTNAERSLREAIALASDYDSSIEDVVITFDQSVFDSTNSRIQLALGELTVTSSLTIDGSGIPNGMIIDGNSNGNAIEDSGLNETRCFLIDDGERNDLFVTLRHLTIQNGFSEESGANIQNREALTLENCQIFNGCVTGDSADGGGIHSLSGSLTMNNCSVVGNQTLGANGDGGGIASEDNSLILTNCTVSHNVSDSANGGGIHSFSANLELTNCTLTQNFASQTGGGIHSLNGNSALQLEHCTIVGNSASSGGAGIHTIRNGISISHSIVSQNQNGDDLFELDVSNPIAIGNSNFISAHRASSTGGISSFTSVSNSIHLAPLGDYGGPTETMPPLPARPFSSDFDVIDAAVGSMNSEDQRGLARDASPDIGAVESDFTVDENNQSSIVVTTALDEIDFAHAERSLRDAIALASGYDSSIEDAVITFDQSVFDSTNNRIQLALGELTVTSSLTIDGSGIPNGMIIDGNSNGNAIEDTDRNETRCFLIDDGDSNDLFVTLRHLTIQNGFSEESGGNIRNREALTLENCRIFNGCVTGDSADGGGIHSASGSLTMNNCSVVGNETLGTNGDGGGIASVSNSLILTNCTVSHNVSHRANGGGIHSFSADLELTNCTLTENFASQAGGGIDSFNGSSPLQLEHCTIVGNTANSGGAGIHTISNGISISHSIVSQNQNGDDLFELNVNNPIPIGDSNFISAHTISSPGGVTNTTLISNSIRLAPLADYGGPTETMPPLPAQPFSTDFTAIDAAVGSTLGVDQRGFPRSGNLDLGAVEVQLSEQLPFDLADFDLDSDQDGMPNGLEFIFGTDHTIADALDPRNPALSVGGDGEVEFRFGKALDLPDGLSLRILRSTTLETDSFSVVATYNSTSNSTTALNNGVFEILIDGGVEEFSFTEPSADSVAFYVIEASYTP